MEGRNGSPGRKEEERRQASEAGVETLRSRQKIFRVHISWKQHSLMAAIQGSSRT